MLSETVVNILCSFIQHEADTGDNKDSPHLSDTIRKLFFLKKSAYNNFCQTDNNPYPKNSFEFFKEYSRNLSHKGRKLQYIIK